MIFLKGEENYTADGWLGIVANQYLYYDVTTSKSLNDNFANILGAIKKKQNQLKFASKLVSNVYLNTYNCLFSTGANINLINNTTTIFENNNKTKYRL